MTPSAPTELLERELLRAFPNVLTLVSGETWNLLPAEPNLAEHLVHERFQVTAPLGGEFCLSFEVGHAKAIAALFLGKEPNDRDSLDSDEQDAIDEAARQIAGAAMDNLKAQLAGAKAEYAGSSPSWSPVRVRTAVLSCGDRTIEFSILMSPELLSADSTKPPAESIAPDTGSHREVSSDGSHSKHNLSLLLDVDLDVTLRFGRREMLLKEVLELASGSIIELDRDVNEPVDLLLNDRVIARGEVVIVDGNYGLRVTEVAAT